MKHTTYQRAVEAFNDIVADYLDLEGDEDLAATVERVRAALKEGRDAAKRAERIVWIEAPLGVHVAKIGRGWAHYSPATRRVDIFAQNGARVARFDATSIESATRKIRAWRKS